MYKRIILKVGTKVLSKDSGQIDEAIIKNLAEQISFLKRKGLEIILITSGAVGSGRSILKLDDQIDNTVADKQIFAAVGQVKLMEKYAKFFEKKNYICAQVLVTKEDFRDRGHYQNMRRCFLNLISHNIIPIVNENDVIAIKELVFTDNDELAGLLAAQLEADAVIMLTSVDGVLDKDPSDPSAKIIPEVDFKNIALAKKNVTSAKTDVGRGGMITKFTVAKKLVSSGIAVHIVNGKKENIVRRIINGDKVGTKFIPQKKTSGLKRRLAYSEGLTMGTVIVNKRAGEMLVAKNKPMSLLPVGITKVEGEFNKGDVIEIKNLNKEKLGFGISSFDSQKIRGMIGKKGGKEVVHYDYMFIE